MVKQHGHDEVTAELSKPAWFRFGGFFRQKLKTSLIQRTHRHCKTFVPTFLTKPYGLTACISHGSSVRGMGEGMAPRHSAALQHSAMRTTRWCLVQGQRAAACQRQVAARSALRRQWAKAKPEHRVPSSTRSGLQETGVGSHQHRGTLRDTMSPSCKAIMLIKHDLAQQTQF